MKTLRFPFFCAAAALVALLATVLPAQEPPPDAPPPAAAEPASPEVAAASDAEPAVAEPLRRLDETVAEAVEETVEVERSRKSRVRAEGLVQFNSDVLLEQGRVASEAVAIFGNVVIDGEVQQAAVAILGDMTVNGSSGGEAVAVLGNVTINGEVRGQVVSVLGTVFLGPEAKVHGEIVSVGGRVQRAPGAQVSGAVQQVAFLGDGVADFDWLKAWIRKCLLLGRPLAFGEDLGWAWGLAFGALAFYAFIALIMPGQVTRCAVTMEQRPGRTLLAAFLTLLITPLLGLLLSVTVVGPLVVGFVMLLVGLFGTAVFLAWLGRRITEPLGVRLPVVAVLVGGGITLLLYVIPFFGFIYQKALGVLGTGMVVYTVLLAMQAQRPPRPGTAARSSGAGAGGSTSAGVTATESATGGGSVLPPLPTGAAESAEPPLQAQAPAGGFVPPPLQGSLLPRVGFWLRLGATTLDFVLLGIVLNLLDNRLFQPSDFFPLLAAVYFVCFWALKGTTIGGIVCGLRVVRLDDRPVDWSVAVVRALGAFLSLAVLGLGFLWVAFDVEVQSWHDKIAGTTVVRVPRGTALV